MMVNPETILVIFKAGMAVGIVLLYVFLVLCDLIINAVTLATHKEFLRSTKQLDKFAAWKVQQKKERLLARARRMK